MSMAGTVNSIASLPNAASGPLQELRSAADRIVGTTFYGTLLKVQRESAFKGPYGHGGRGEEAFGAQLDQLLAEEAGKSRSFSLTDAIVSRFENKVRALAAASAERDQA